jgi:hypothetical protein
MASGVGDDQEKRREWEGGKDGFYYSQGKQVGKEWTGGRC